MSESFEPKPLTLYTTPPHDCSYLPDLQAKTLFLSPSIQINQPIYTLLSNLGFRRSGDHLYRPHCENCHACVPVRIPVDRFKPNKQQKRCQKNGAKFRSEITPAIFDMHYFQLFEKYINKRHVDGGMYPTSPQQYMDFLLNSWAKTQYLSFYSYDTNQLVAVAVFDLLDDGVSAVYTYFDPDYEKYSLGRLAVLSLIEHAQNLSLPYVYLGYWIKNCQKMSYKGQYRPLDCFVGERWITLL